MSVAARRKTAGSRVRGEAARRRPRRYVFDRQRADWNHCALAHLSTFSGDGPLEWWREASWASIAAAQSVMPSHSRLPSRHRLRLPAVARLEAAMAPRALTLSRPRRALLVDTTWRNLQLSAARLHRLHHHRPLCRICAHTGRRRANAPTWAQLHAVQTSNRASRPHIRNSTQLGPIGLARASFILEHLQTAAARLATHAGMRGPCSFG
jgi:hypothetical protein